MNSLALLERYRVVESINKLLREITIKAIQVRHQVNIKLSEARHLNKKPFGVRYRVTESSDVKPSRAP